MMRLYDQFLPEWRPLRDERYLACVMIGLNAREYHGADSL